MNSKNREEWNLNHPNDEIPVRLGIDGQYIPERYIPFDSSSLETFDVIINEDDERLIYYKEDKSYKIYISSAYAFLPNPFKKWVKYEYPKTSDQSLSTTGPITLGGNLHQNTTLSSEEFNKMKAEQILYNVCMNKLEKEWQAVKLEGKIFDFEVEVPNPTSPEILAKMQDERQGTHTTITNMTREEIKEKYNVDITDDRYFTPSIEDIHVGYQCEVLFEKGVSQVYFRGKDGWEKQTINSTQVSIVPHYIDMSKIRVPYLTKEQIEKEGWKYSDTVYTMDNNSVISYRKSGTDSIVIYIQATKYLMIKKNVPYGDKINEIYAYQGECKDINTFRYICKLLGI